MRKALCTLLLLAGVLGAQDDAAPAYLGVRVGPVGEETRALFRIPEDIEKGAVLVDVERGSPAQAAGLRRGDVVTSFDGKAIADEDDLVAAVRARKARDAVAYVVRRGSGTIDGTLRLGARPAPAMEKAWDAPAPAPRPDEVDERLERLRKDLKELRERLEKPRARGKAPMRHPRSLGGWIHREERAAKAARKKGDEKAYRYHAIRLGVLEEMREAMGDLPLRRLDRIERKLDLVLEKLGVEK